MRPVAVRSSSHRYAIFRYVTDAERDLSVPIGVALWQHDGGPVYVRLKQQDEAVKGIRGFRPDMFIEATEHQIAGWVRSGQLPYGPEGVESFSDAWWDHLTKLLQFRVRVSTARAIECTDPAHEVEALYDAVVGPEVKEEVVAVRVDGAVTKALGKEAKLFAASRTVSGYNNREVAVRRLYQGPNKRVIADGVNLASPNAAEHDADALASRVQRIIAGDEQPTEFLLGYIASPGGLNGEGVLVDWIQEKSGVRMYDLIAEDAAYEEAARQAIAGEQDQPPLLVMQG